MGNTVIKLVAVLLAQGITYAHASDINVGVSVSGQVAPGVYGRVDIGNTPPPVLYPQPVVITRPARPVSTAPIYLHVPPGHAKKWDKHCHKYNACNQPVYFVKSAEYEGGGNGHKEKKNKHGRDH